MDKEIEIYVQDSDTIKQNKHQLFSHMGRRLNIFIRFHDIKDMSSEDAKRTCALHLPLAQSTVLEIGISFMQMNPVLCHG